MLIDPDGIASTVVAEYPKVGTIGTRLELAENPLAQMLIKDPFRPLVIEDVDSDSRFPDAIRALLTEQIGIHGMVILPLLLQEKLLGSIGLDVYERGRRFDSDVIQTAQTMSAQLAIALQNVRLLNETRQRAAQLQRVASFGQSVQATLQDEAIFRTMFAETSQMLTVDTITIALYDSYHAQMRAAAQYQNESIEMFTHGAATISLEGTLPGQVWKSLEIAAVGDTAMQKDAPPLPNMPSATRSIMIAPILMRRHPFGLIILTSDQPYSYGSTEVAIFEQMMNLFTVALENSRNYAQTQKLAQNEALINQISTQLQQVSSLDGMLQVTMRELGQALKARRARIRLSVQTAAALEQGEY
jgi:GAF domain-containing protein